MQVISLYNDQKDKITIFNKMSHDLSPTAQALFSIAHLS